MHIYLMALYEIVTKTQALFSMRQHSFETDVFHFKICFMSAPHMFTE